MAGRKRNVVKSVGRVFSVLEMFEREGRPLNAVSIARKLHLPTSSNIALLKSMVTLGYLHFEHANSTYFPTVRLSFLGNRFSHLLVGAANLTGLVDAVGQTTGESVALCCENDLYAQYLKVRTSAHPLTYNLSEGHLVPLFRSCVGMMLLSTKTDQEIVRIAEKVSRRRDPEERKIDLPATLSLLRKFRGRPYVSHYDLFTPGLGLITWVLNAPNAQQPLVFVVGGPTPRIRSAEAEIVRAVESAMDRLRQ